MTKPKVDAVEAAAETVPERSRARLALAACIEAREKARETIADRQGALRRLQLVCEAAKALAGQLAGAKAAAAAKLAAHALAGSGPVPTLVEAGRTDLLTRLAEAEERAEAAVPAMKTVEEAITAAVAAHDQATAAAVAAAGPVVREEIDRLAGEVRDAIAALRPLTERLAGARAYAYALAHETSATAERDVLLRYGSRLDEAMASAGVDPRTPHNGQDAAWASLAQRLTIDADAVAA